MYKAIHHDGLIPLVDIPAYLKRHDIVYKRPAIKAYDGLPIGNGTMGGLLFHTRNSLSIQINHTDAIDFSPDGPMKAWAWEAEEKNTAPISPGTLSIESDLPCFDWMYLKSYEERLNLADGCIEGHAKSPVMELHFTVYSSKAPDLLVFDIEADQKEAAAWTIRAERWPSSNFFHHYEQVVSVYDKNMDIVNAEIKEDALLLNQNMGRCQVSMAVRIKGEEAIPELLHSKCGIFHLKKQKKHHFQVLIHASASENGLETAISESLRQTDVSDLSILREKNKAEWHDFWNKSFIYLSDADYLENLYYIYLYQLNSCGLGRYPITFGGLWTWLKDSRNWGHFYHWNHQQTYWPVLSSGHPELYHNYLDYRFGMLPTAKEDASRLFGANGAFFSDVSNLNGQNAIEPDTIRNYSVGAQISLDFYHYYRYTKDRNFLSEKALPMMCACVDFYLSILDEQDGCLHIRGGSTCYESYWNLKDTLTDYASLKAVLRVLVTIGETEGLPQNQLTAYCELEKKLYRPVTEVLTHQQKELEIYSAGTKWNDAPVGYGEGSYPCSPFPATLTSPVYPSRLIGLNQKNSHAFQIMTNTARVLLDKELYHLGTLGCSGHAPAPEMAARLGMADDMFPILKRYATAYQIFPNGLMHFADITANQQWSQTDTPRILDGRETATQWEELHKKSCGTRTSIPSDWFLHCYFEASANIAAGIQEMLLQSTDGILRVFPAFSEDNGSAMFTLWAEDAIRVTSEAFSGDIRYVALTSVTDNICHIANPWPDESVTIRYDETRWMPYSIENSSILSFPMEAGKTYILFRNEFPPECYYQNPFSDHRNQEIKYLDNVQLGLEKYY